MKWFHLLILSIALYSCQAQSTTHNEEYGLISAAEAQKLLEKDNVVFIDVRTAAEVQKGKINGAHHHNFYDDNFVEHINKLPKNVTYVVYCASGIRSAKAVQLMQQAGFKKLYDLKGGYAKWEKDK